MKNAGSHDRTLTLERTIHAPRASVWRCWTEADLLKQWYCPKPWGVSHAELDVRVGGRNYVLMAGPSGEHVPVAGVYLDVVPLQKLVFTDAFDRAWMPSDKAFMVADISLDDAPGGDTRYVARVLHWSASDRKQHETMGFQEGWGAAAAQLEELAQSLPAR